MVFDDEALQALPKSSVDLNNSQSYMYSTIDERSLIAQFSFDLGNSVSAGALLMKLKAGLEAGITGDIASYCYKYYNMLEHNVERYRLSINNYSYKNTYADCYSDAFLNDLNKVKGNTMSYEAFFGRYGTHIVGSAVYGGKLNAYYTVLSKDKLINQDVKTALDGVISFQNIISNRAIHLAPFIFCVSLPCLPPLHFLLRRVIQVKEFFIGIVRLFSIRVSALRACITRNAYKVRRCNRILHIALAKLLFNPLAKRIWNFAPARILTAHIIRQCA